MYLDNNPFQVSGRQKTPVDPVALNVLLASHTSMLYSWHVTVADLLQPGRDRSNALRVGGEVVPPSHLVGVVELPLKVPPQPHLIVIQTVLNRLFLTCCAALCVCAEPSGGGAAAAEPQLY